VALACDLAGVARPGGRATLHQTQDDSEPQNQWCPSGSEQGHWEVYWTSRGVEVPVGRFPLLDAWLISTRVSKRRGSRPQGRHQHLPLRVVHHGQRLQNPEFHRALPRDLPCRDATGMAPRCNTPSLG
jgi:hypothetical protein